VTPGDVLREARYRRGVSQAQLASRAGTRQSAISRIESGRVSPTFETLRNLLDLLGEELTIGSEHPDTGIDLTLNEGNLRLSPEDRVRKGLGWADFVRENRGGDNPSPAAEAHMAKADLGDGLELHPLLGALIRNGVDFVVVGGVAGWVHGSSYPTFDLDVAYARGQANLERLAKALRELRARWRGGPPDLPIELDAAMLDKGANFTFETPFGNFDVLGELSGVGDYEELRREARTELYDGLEIRVASLDHLIAMKSSADRVKDRLMVMEYKELSGLREPAPQQRPGPAPGGRRGR
jgi:transcriptional regulator with XRE-family HTH domain